MKEIKCVIWDLDNTLWDGILLEGDELLLKPGIREILATLDSRGILLSIASKNNYEHAMDKLKEFDIDAFFLYPQIGWGAKSHAVEAVRQALNIGMDTILFIDDQEYELDEVKEAWPLVTTMHSDHYSELLAMERLQPKVITVDSNRRRLMYLEDQKRQADERAYEGPSTDFLAGLNLQFTISPAREQDLMRAEELTIRTNQLNSTGIFYSYEDLKRLMDSPTHELWICELTDRYGSYGKIGLALAELQDSAYRIKLLLMSCRTVSRGVGTVLLSFLMKQAISAKKRLEADFVRTDRNRQMLLTYQLANFKVQRYEGETTVYENDLSIIQDYPSFIKVIEVRS